MGSTSAPRDGALAPPAFRDRGEAGARLGARLREVLASRADNERAVESPARSASGSVLGGPPTVVLALPRGGVPVAAEVARLLRAPLGIVLVRKIGHPQAPELGLGAIAEDGLGGTTEPFFDEEMLARVRLNRDDLADVVARERLELARRAAAYASGRAAHGLAQWAASLMGKRAIVVDDGLATGVTARAALRALRARGAQQTVLAVPVAALEAVRALESETGEVVTLVTTRRFSSVGEWYVDFGQLTDADVLSVLASPP